MPFLIPELAALAPALFMALAAVLACVPAVPLRRRWQLGAGLAVLGLVAAVVAPFLPAAAASAWLAPTPVAGLVAVLVQALGLVIVVFSARYLEGEPGQPRYLAALCAVLASVQVLLLAQHWIVLVLAWSLAGRSLEPLLCFYRERPFALLAAHKKRLADRLADLMLVAAAALAWHEVGSGALPELWAHLAREGASPALQACALLLCAAVFLRTALLPVHGWLVQVMEAPTPVSALLHAGVVNLGGFVLVRFAPLLEAAPLARGLLVAGGLATAVLAGFVMLTRVSIKVRLAWSTVAQMGFMVLECGLGLYSLAMLHLLGHSLYKAQAFLSASGVVRRTRLAALHAASPPALASLWLAPPVAMLVVHAVMGASWPAWWTLIAGLALAPLLWIRAEGAREAAWQALAGLAMVLALALLARLGHGLPLGVADAPNDLLGGFAAGGMALLYGGVAWLQRRPQGLPAWRRWSFAGFYVDEAYTRLALRWWPRGWMRPSLEGAADAGVGPQGRTA